MRLSTRTESLSSSPDPPSAGRLLLGWYVLSPCPSPARLARGWWSPPEAQAEAGALPGPPGEADSEPLTRLLALAVEELA